MPSIFVCVSALHFDPWRPMPCCLLMIKLKLGVSSKLLSWFSAMTKTNNTEGDEQIGIHFPHLQLQHPRRYPLVIKHSYWNHGPLVPWFTCYFNGCNGDFPVRNLWYLQDAPLPGEGAALSVIAKSLLFPCKKLPHQTRSWRCYNSFSKTLHIYIYTYLHIDLLIWMYEKYNNICIDR